MVLSERFEGALHLLALVCAGAGMVGTLLSVRAIQRGKEESAPSLRQARLGRRWLILATSLTLAGGCGMLARYAPPVAGLLLVPLVLFLLVVLYQLVAILLLLVFGGPG